MQGRIKTFTLFLFLLFTTCFIKAQPVWQWAKGAGGGGFDAGTGITADVVGNVYACGTFESPVAKFGNIQFTNEGLADGYIAKYSATGQLKWIRHIGGTGDGDAKEVACDANGFCYVTGTFSGTLIIEGNTIESSGSTDIFIACFNPIGVLQWIKTGSGTGEDIVYDIQIDNAGNILATGAFKNSITFDDMTVTASSSVNYDTWVAKFNGSGNCQWAVHAGGSGSANVFCYSLALNSFNDVILSGTLYGNIYFGAYHITGTGYGYIAKLNSAGVWQWATGTGDNLGGDVNGVATDASGNIYTTGYFGYNGTGTAHFGGILLTASGTYSDMFIAKYDALGNILWAKSGGSTDYQDYANRITVTQDGDIHITGWIGGDAVFGPLSFTNPHPGLQEIVVLEYDTFGNEIWGISAGGTQADEGADITRDAFGKIYITGFFSKTAYFGTTMLKKGTSGNGFIAKLSDPEPKLYGNAENEFSVYPTLAREQVHVKSESRSAFTILSEEGKIIETGVFEIGINTIDISGLIPGIYFITIQENGRQETRKFIRIN